MRLQQRLVFDQAQSLLKSDGSLKTPPLSRMATPQYIEPGFAKALFHVVEADERSIELFTGILGEPRAVAHDEAVVASPPLAEDADRIIERRPADVRQEPGLQGIGDEALTSGGDGARSSAARALPHIRLRAGFAIQPPPPNACKDENPDDRRRFAYSHSIVPGGLLVTS